MIGSAEDVATIMRWEQRGNESSKQKELFVELNESEKKIVDLLRAENEAHIDSISSALGLFGSQLAVSLLNLEFKGVVISLPGKMYRMV